MKVFASAPLATLGLLAALASAVRAEGPVAIRTPPLLVPEETAGSGLSPEAAVELAIDARGAVSEVEVQSITPTTEFDDVFRRSLLETLSKWRFAPATKDGRAIPSRLSWRVRFPAAAEEAGSNFVEEPLAGADAERRRAAILGAPVESRMKLLQKQAESAMRHLQPGRVKEAVSGRFVVHTDADDDRTAPTVAANLEAIFNVLAADLLPGIRLQEEPYKLQVFAYRTHRQYRAMVAEQTTFEQSSGFYSPAGLIALHLEMPTSSDVLAVLLHEGTHAFLDRHVVRPGVALSRWMGEGFAEYVGNSVIEKGRLRPGRTVVHRVTVESGRLMAGKTEAGLRVDAAKQALRRGKGLGVRELLGASPAIFYGEQAGLYYASAWLLTHFLRDGSADWASQRFPTLLLYLAEGYSEEAALRAVYGPSDSLDGQFRRYVQGF